MAGKSSSRIRTGALLVFVIALSVLLAEGLVRLVGPAAPRVVAIPHDVAAQDRRRAENESDLRLESFGDSSEQIFVETPAGRRLRANAHVRIRHFMNGRELDFRTNSIGYRNREIGPKTIQRVLFLGDSVTGGDYLEEHETFVRQVEQMSWRTGRPLETINAGIGAIGLMNELAILEETGLATQPDVVVLGFYLNDFNESYAFDSDLLPRWLERSHLAWLLVRSFRILDLELLASPKPDRLPAALLRAEIEERFPPRKGDPLVDRAAFYREVGKAVVDWGGAWSEENWRAMRPLFLRFREMGDAHGFEPLIVVFPVELQAAAAFVEDWPQQQAKQIGAELDIPVLDMLPFLRSLGDPGRFFYDQCHYNPAGNQHVAEAIVEFIDREVAVPQAEVPAALRMASAR